MSRNSENNEVEAEIIQGVHCSHKLNRLNNWAGKCVIVSIIKTVQDVSCFLSSLKDESRVIGAIAPSKGDQSREAIANFLFPTGSRVQRLVIIRFGCVRTSGCRCIALIAWRSKKICNKLKLSVYRNKQNPRPIVPKRMKKGLVFA